MRVRFAGSLLVCFLIAAGCGSSASNNDAHDGPVDGRDGGTDVRADKGNDTGTTTDSGSGNDGATDTGGEAGDGGADAAPDATGDAATDGRDGGDGGLDGAVPSCADGIKDGDETGIDCGGRCGKCGPGQPCVLGTDCQFGVCKTDGTCGGCAAATDCPGVESECQHRTCTAGVCGMATSPAGTVLTVQTSGDCKQRQCASDGTVQVVSDDTDVPDDRNPCTNDLCSGGTPSHTLMPADTNCGGANTCNATGQCVGCAVANDCPGTDTACRTRTCSAQGVCGFAYVAAGTKLADPTAGDCKGLQCDGNGNFAIVNDDADVPTDNNACTTDSCNAGTPSHQPSASGTGCGGSLVCDGAGSCVECVSASTCPGDDTECHARTCLSNHCGIRNVAAGTALAAQTPKDCKKNQCDGNGGTQTVPDDTDLPVDDNACTRDVCTQGIPSNPFITAGTTCAVNQICDGNGACVGCVIASNCPGTDTECHTRTCVSSTCGFSNKAAGTMLFTQTAGDCKKAQCDGNGGVTTVADDTDKPVDGNACTQDICTNGTPSNPDLASGTSCGTSLVCDGNGDCVGCVTAADCPGTDTTCQHRTCTNNHCGVSNAAAGTALPTQTAGDCKKDQCDGNGGVTTVADDTDKPVDGNSCTQDVCSQGLVSNPPEAAGVTCAQNGGTRCNGAGACVQCLQASDCPGTDSECHVRTCTAGVCGVSNTAFGTVVSSQSPGDCKKNICSGTGSVIQAVDDTDVPVDGNACTQDVCTNGVPSNPAAAANAPCTQGGGTRCNGSATAPACVQCLQASDCPGTDTDCHARTCTAGVCGVSNAASGTAVTAQTAGDCHKNVCNGSGGVIAAIDDTDVPVDGNSCTSDVCISGVASNPPVATGTACSTNGGSFCNAAGSCVQCLTAATCPGGPDTACHTRTCTNGTCGVSTAVAGTLVTNAPAGNCHKDVCDANGNAVTVVDDTDVPADGNACTQDVCTNGTPSNPPVSSGTSCGTGLVCDGNGACVGCVTAADCPGTDTTCRHRVCNSGSCGFSDAVAGTLVTVAPAGDCQKTVCDGNGGTTSAPDDTDVPSSSNPCLGGACNNGTPSNPALPAGTSCSQGSGVKCDGAGSCVACLTATDCGADTTCQHRTCTSGSCGVANAAFGTLVTNAPAGDCHKDVCDGSGSVTTVVDDGDVPANTNECLQNVCINGVPSNPAQPAGSPCDQGGLLCDGAGSCVQCLVASTCPGGADTTCHTKTCVGGVCGLQYASAGTPVTTEPAGDCQQIVCDATGGTTSVPDDADLPTSTNQCVQNVCTSGVASNPAKAAGTACNQTGGTECDGAGACVQCVTAADCPGGPDTECSFRTCTNGVCGVATPDLGTPLATQTAGDCQTAVCDGLGGTTTLANDTDVPTNTNQCTTETCSGGAVQTTNATHGTTCSQNGGRTCDGSGSCLLTFNVIRVGDGSATLTSTATAVFVEERKLDGTLLGTVTLPSAAASSGNAALTQSGSASSEGGLSLSGDGRYVVLAGYNQTAGMTGSVSGTTSASVNRVVGRIDASGAVNTTTRIAAAFNTNNVRGATSQDGTSFWVGGAGSGSTTNAGGTWYVTLGNSSGATQLAPTPALNNTRWPQIFGGQLYSSASTGTFNNILTVGAGLPTAGAPTMTAMTSLPGMPTSGASPFGYVFFDTDGTAGYDTLYVADDNSSVHGIQKWTLSGGSWSKTTTFNLSTAVGFRGLAGYANGSTITLIASTDDALPRLVVFVDNGGTATSTVIATSAANTAFRGVALSPHL